jgi:Tfp pilus assembly protein PilE
MNRKGMILVEAIISVVIISISLTLIMQSFLSSYRSVVFQKDYTQALIGIENQLSKIFFDPQSVSKEDRSESFKKFEYRRSASKSMEGMDKIVLDVHWPSGRSQRHISVATFIYDENNKKQN